METISKRATEDKKLVEVLQNKKATDREKQKAFEELYSRHQSQMSFYFKKNVKDHEVAEDLKMVVFQKVHLSIGGYDKKTAVFSTWLYKIALNTLIDHKRKEKIEVLSLNALADKTSEDNDGMEFQILSDAVTPEEKMVRDEKAKAVRIAINSIKSESIRRIMELRFLKEMSFEEIAEVEGIDDNSTLRVTVMRGQNMIKDSLVNVNIH